MAHDDFTPYRPSNGTEGRRFTAEHCDRCVSNAPYERWLDDGEQGEPPQSCDILAYALCFSISDPEYPREKWVYLGGEPTCLFFREEGGGKDESIMSPDPNQMELFDHQNRRGRHCEKLHT